MIKKNIEVFIKNKTVQDEIPGMFKRVSKGYARNYLIPYNIAEIPSKKRLKYLKNIEQEQINQRQELLQQQEKLKNSLEIVKQFTIKKKTTDTGIFFGSITEKDIYYTIYKTTGIKLLKNKIPKNSIKTIGIHNMLIQFSENIKVNIELQILPETK